MSDIEGGNVILKSSLEGCKFVALRGGRNRSWRIKTSTRDASWKERLALLGPRRRTPPKTEEFQGLRPQDSLWFGLLSRIILRLGLKIAAESERNEVVLGKVEHFESQERARSRNAMTALMSAGAIVN